MARSGKVFKGAAIGVAGMLMAGLLVAALREDAPRPDPGPYDAEVQYMIDRAEHRVIMDCMRRRGLDYPQAPEGEEGARPEPLPDAPRHPFGVDDVDWARAHGFGSDLKAAALQAADAARAADPVARAFAALPEAHRTTLLTALYGAESEPAVSVTLPTGHVVTTRTAGCQAEARAALYGDQERWLRVSAVVQALPGLAVRAVSADPRFTQAEQTWSTCMRALGHPATGIDALRERFHAEAQALPQARRRELEVRLAVAEATCARQTGVTALGERLEREALGGAATDASYVRGGSRSAAGPGSHPSGRTAPYPAWAPVTGGLIAGCRLHRAQRRKGESCAHESSWPRCCPASQQPPRLWCRRRPTPSWYNNGVYIPGGPDDVAVYDQEDYQGDPLFCLWRGQSISYNAAYNDKPSSHKWVVSC